MSRSTRILLADSLREEVEQLTTLIDDMVKCAEVLENLEAQENQKYRAKDLLKQARDQIAKEVKP